MLSHIRPTDTTREVSGSVRRKVVNGAWRTKQQSREYHGQQKDASALGRDCSSRMSLSGGLRGRRRKWEVIGEFSAERAAWLYTPEFQPAPLMRSEMDDPVSKSG